MHFAIIAAGQGSRLHQEGIALPKPLVQIGGKPLTGRLIDLFIACRAESVSVIINEQAAEVDRYLMSLSLPVPLHITRLTTPGSMHSLAAMNLARLGGKVIVTTVDTVFAPREFEAYCREFETSHDTDAMMAVTRYIDDEKPLYVVTRPGTMEVTDFADAPAEGSELFASGGIYGLTPRALSILDHCLAQGMTRMRRYQRALVQQGLTVRAVEFSKIIDVDHAADIPKAERLLDDIPDITHSINQTPFTK